MKRVLLAIVLFSPAWAAVHAVRPSTSTDPTNGCANNGNGTTWACAASPGGAGAFAGVPATLTVGDVYYLGDGTYASYTYSSSGSSASAQTEIRKAQDYDFGGMAGWQAATSGFGAGQAIFPHIVLSASFAVINGNGQQTAPGCGGAVGSDVTAHPGNPKDCGISVVENASAVHAINTSGTTHPTVEYVELLGNGINNTNSLAELFCTGTCSQENYVHIYIHNSGCDNMQYGLNAATVDHSYFWGTETAGNATACHGQSFQVAGGVSNTTYSNNVVRDICGTAAWTFGINETATFTGWVFYNNVVFRSSPAVSWITACSAGSGGFANGYMSCLQTQGGACNNFSFIQNTFVNLNNVNINTNSNLTGSYLVKDNLFYSNGTAPGGSFVTLVGNQVFSSPNPFVSWPNNYDFHLASEAAPWNARVGCTVSATCGSLFDPFNDPSGVTHSTDVGAYQFVAAGCAITPTSLSTMTAGQSINVAFSQTGCAANTFTISAGSLTGSGLSLNASCGVSPGTGCALTGTAVAGSYSFTVAYPSASNPFALTINAAPSITTASLPNGQVGVAYNQPLTITGGTAPVSCAVTTGGLPNGLALSNCTVTGTPTLQGPFFFTITPTDTNGISGSGVAYSVTIAPVDTTTPIVLHTAFCGPGSTWPLITPCSLGFTTTAGTRIVVAFLGYNSGGSTNTIASMADGGDTFTQIANCRSTNTAAGNTSWSDCWSASSGAGGMTTINVTPTVSQIGNVFVWEVQYGGTLVGAASASSQAATTSPASPGLTVGAKTLLLAYLHPGAVENGAPSATTSPFTQDLITAGMAWSHYNAANAGTYNAGWTQTNATYGAGIVALQAPSGCAITPASLGPWTIGQVINASFTATGCNASSWSSTGTWPTGVSFNAGLASGTIGGTSGTFTPAVSYDTASNSYSIPVNSAASITTSSPLPNATEGSPYSQTLVTTGGTGAITCAVTAGSLTGSSLVLGSNCALTGVAGTAGPYNFTVTPTDANNVSGTSKAFSLSINSPTPLGGSSVGGSAVMGGKTQRF